MDGDVGGESGKIPLDVALLAGALLAMLCCRAADLDPYQAHKEQLWYRYGVVVRLPLQSGNAAEEAVQGILVGVNTATVVLVWSCQMYCQTQCLATRLPYFSTPHIKHTLFLFCRHATGDMKRSEGCAENTGRPRLMLEASCARF